MRIIGFFDKGATLYPGNVAFSDATGQFSYRQAEVQTHLIASALHERGFGVGTRIGLLAPNCYVAFLALLGVLRAGAVCLPVDPRKTVADNSNFLDHLNSDLLLYHSVYEADARKISKRVSTVQRAVCIDDKIEFGPSLPYWIRHAHPTITPPDDALDDTLLIAASDDARYLSFAPIAHPAGLLGCRHFACGGTNFIMSTVDPGGILSAIQEYGITHLYAPSALLRMMLMHPYVELFDYKSIQRFMTDASTSVEQLNRAIEIFGPVMAVISFQRQQDKTQSVLYCGMSR